MKLMSSVQKLAAAAAIALAAPRLQAVPTSSAKAVPHAPAKNDARQQPPTNGYGQVAQLWEQEGQTLRALASTATGTDRAEALLRLGEWERQSAKRVRAAVEDGRIARQDGERQITQHLDAAKIAYSQAIPIASPERLPEVLFSLGDLERFRNDPGSARTPLAKLVDEHPKHPLAVDAAIALGDDAFDAGKLADAMHRYEFAAKAARTPGGRAYAEYKLAWCHLNLQEYEQSRALLLDVISLSTGNGKSINLADEARRDFVLALARDPKVKAPGAERQIRGLGLDPDRTRRYIEGYAGIIAGAGRDEEAATTYGHIERHSPPSDAIRIFTAELEIAIRQRNLAAEERSAMQLAQVVSAYPTAVAGEHDAAEHALRVAAVTVHGEGRARGDRQMLLTAVDLYNSYFLAFDSDPAAYELHHHAGELLANLKQPAAAERNYTAAVERDLARLAAHQPPGKWLLSSAQGAVTNAQDALPKTALPTRQAQASDDAVAHPPPAPTLLSEPEHRFVAACDRYLQALPEGPEAVDVRYQRALMFFRHNLLQEAGTELQQIALQHPESAPATFAAQLAMDALRMQGRYDDLAALTAQMAKVAALKSKLGDELETTHEAALLAAAAREATQQHYAVAARRYLDFVHTYPHSTRLDRALYNGAAALVQDGRLAEGVALRERLLRDCPKSPLLGRAKKRQLSEILMLGRFSEGERLAEEIAHDASGSEAATRLHDAVVLAEAAGDTKEADQIRQEYLKKHRTGPDAMPYALTLAEHTQGCAAALKAYGKALAMSPDTAWRTVALTRLARQEQRCHKETEARIHAAEAAALGAHLKAERGDALDAAADAALLTVQPLVEAYRKLPLREPYQRTLPRKLAALKAADDRLAQVVARGRAAPAVCALVSSGELYSDVARALGNARPPRAFNSEQRELFKEQLAEKSQPLFDHAKTTLMEAITRAREAGIAPLCLNEARKTLAALWPERFGPQEEAVVKLGPDLQTASVNAAAILAKAPDAPPAWLIAAQAELSVGHPQAAIVLVNRIDPSDHLYPQALETKARALDAMGQTEASLALWLKLVKDYPNRTLARRILADRAMASRDLEAAKEHLLALRQTDARDPGVALNLGVVLRGLGDIEGAEKSIRAAAQLAPNKPEAELDLGLLLCGEGNRPTEGIAELEEFAKAGGHPPDTRGFEAAMAACRALAKENHK